MYIYLFWTHSENGPEDLLATTDRSKLNTILRNSGYSEYSGLLANLLSKSDVELINTNSGVYNLSGGWGGIHFQIVEEL